MNELVNPWSQNWKEEMERKEEGEMRTPAREEEKKTHTTGKEETSVLGRDGAETKGRWERERDSAPDQETHGDQKGGHPGQPHSPLHPRGIKEGHCYYWFCC
jgi:hypothetical protein